MGDSDKPSSTAILISTNDGEKKIEEESHGKGLKSQTEGDSIMVENKSGESNQAVKEDKVANTTNGKGNGDSKQESCDKELKEQTSEKEIDAGNVEAVNSNKQNSCSDISKENGSSSEGVTVLGDSNGSQNEPNASGGVDKETESISTKQLGVKRKVEEVVEVSQEEKRTKVEETSSLECSEAQADNKMKVDEPLAEGTAKTKETAKRKVMDEDEDQQTKRVREDTEEATNEANKIESEVSTVESSSSDATIVKVDENAKEDHTKKEEEAVENKMEVEAAPSAVEKEDTDRKEDTVSLPQPMEQEADTSSTVTDKSESASNISETSSATTTSTNETKKEASAIDTDSAVGGKEAESKPVEKVSDPQVSAETVQEVAEAQSGINTENKESKTVSVQDVQSEPAEVANQEETKDKKTSSSDKTETPTSSETGTAPEETASKVLADPVVTEKSKEEGADVKADPAPEVVETKPTEDVIKDVAAAPVIPEENVADSVTSVAKTTEEKKETTSDTSPPVTDSATGNDQEKETEKMEEEIPTSTIEKENSLETGKSLPTEADTVSTAKDAANTENVGKTDATPESTETMDVEGSNPPPVSEKEEISVSSSAVADQIENKTPTDKMDEDKTDGKEKDVAIELKEQKDAELEKKSESNEKVQLKQEETAKTSPDQQETADKDINAQGDSSKSEANEKGDETKQVTSVKAGKESETESVDKVTEEGEKVTEKEAKVSMDGDNEKQAVENNRMEVNCEAEAKSETVENGDGDTLHGQLPVDNAKKHIKENVLQEIPVNKEMNVPAEHDKTKPEKVMTEEKEKVDCDKDENNIIASNSESKMEDESNGIPNAMANATSIPVGVAEPMDCD